MGINVMALKWFQSYLSDIYRYVNFEGLSSKSVPLNHGVTQGSALGWVLINIYITPLANIIRELGIEFHVYINDYQLYLEFQPTSGPYEWFFKWGADRRPANWISGGWKGACGISGKSWGPGWVIFEVGRLRPFENHCKMKWLSSINKAFIIIIIIIIITCGL